MDMNVWIRQLRVLRCDSGQDLLEYGLLAALIAVVSIGAVTRVGDTINTVFWQAIASANV
jgi:Flp pilus assembly pilin Flp